MSVRFSGAAVLGFRVSMAGFVSRPASGCEHREASGNNFCPRCGAAQAREEVHPSHEAFRDAWRPEPPLVKYYVRPDRWPRTIAEDVAYVGYGAECAAFGAKMVKLENFDLEAMRWNVRLALGQGGFVAALNPRDEEFGLWVVVHGS